MEPNTKEQSEIDALFADEYAREQCPPDPDEVIEDCRDIRGK